MQEQKLNETKMPNNIILEDRCHLELSGVLEVISFEEDSVQLKTTNGKLNISGTGMKMASFMAEAGDLIINGNIYALVYLNDSVVKESFFSRIFK